MKSYLKYLPVIGWMWWCAEYVFLKRSGSEDLPVLKKSLEELKDYPIPFFVSLKVCTLIKKIIIIDVLHVLSSIHATIVLYKSF